MQFLSPLALIGLAAAAIPIVIHLFNFRRPKRVDFSSLAFLKELQKSTMRRLRIRQWVLLALRTLAIACLVLAFARPTLTGPLFGTIGQRATSAVALVIDNSLSMTRRDTQGAYSDQARDAASALTDLLDTGDEFHLIPTAGTVGEPFQTPALAAEAVVDIEPAPGATSAGDAMARAGLLLGRAPNLNRELYIVSDLQRSTFLDSVGLDLPADARIFLVPVGEGGSEAQANVAVTGVNVVSRIVEAGQPVRLEATLQNFGTRNLEGYVVSVFFEGNRVAQNAVDLSAGGTATVDFTATPQRRGWLAGEVRGEDDAFEADNVRHFTLNVPERRRILVVRGDGQRTDFIELALSPELTRGRVAFDATTVSEAQLPATNLGRFDAVVLVGLRTVSSGEASALRGFVESGGGVLVFPSAEAATGAYDALMPALGGGAFAGLTGQIGAAEPATSFGRVDREHPLFDGVFDSGPGRQVESPDFYAVADYMPGRGDEQTLIQLSTGRPFLQEVRQGEGVSLVLAVPPERAWSDLPVRGLFVPLLYRSLFYLSASDGAGTGDAVLGEPASVRVAGAGPFVLAGPNGAEYAPEQRSVYGATLVELPAAAQEAGVYDLRTATGETMRRVALNLPPDESDLRRLSTSDAASRLEAATGRPVTIAEAGGDGSVLANTVREARYGTELWNVFLALALAFLVAEMLVSKQWRPESELATA